jgi:transcriptional regulator with XRE-family HTH domain
VEDTRDQHDVALGQAIRKLRKQTRLTQQRLSDLAQVPMGDLRQIERGRVDADWGTIRHLAKALDVSLVDVFLLTASFADPNSGRGQ